MFRETSFQQVLLSSSGPKENIFLSNFYIPIRCIRKCFPNNFVYNNFQFCNFFMYKTDVIVLYCDRCYVTFYVN